MIVLEIGKRYRVFKTNNYTYEGKLVALDDNFIKVLDDKTGIEQIMPIATINNIEAR